MIILCLVVGFWLWLYDVPFGWFLMGCAFGAAIALAWRAR